MIDITKYIELYILERAVIGHGYYITTIFLNGKRFPKRNEFVTIDDTQLRSLEHKRFQALTSDGHVEIISWQDAQELFRQYNQIRVGKGRCELFFARNEKHEVCGITV